MLQNLLNKVADGVSEINKSHDFEVTTRMEVLTGIISELERMFTVLSVSSYENITWLFLG